MTNTKREQINRRFTELVGLCWHEDAIPAGLGTTRICSCGAEGWPDSCRNPDFIAHPTLVLKEMGKRCKTEYEFAQFLFSLDIHGTYALLLRGFIDTYILDETEGLLVKAAIKWLEKGDGHAPT